MSRLSSDHCTYMYKYKYSKSSLQPKSDIINMFPIYLCLRGGGVFSFQLVTCRILVHVPRLLVWEAEQAMVANPDVVISRDDPLTFEKKKSHPQAATTQTSLRIYAVSPELSLLAYTENGIRQRHTWAKHKPLAPLVSCACVFKE